MVWEKRLRSRLDALDVVSHGDKSGVVDALAALAAVGGALVTFLVLVLCNVWLVVRFIRRLGTFWRRGGE